jgi:undecaprenyl-diphosphatase
VIGRTGSLPGPSELEPPAGIARFVRPRWLAASAATWAVFAGLSYLSTVHPYFPVDVSMARWVQSVNWGPLTLAFPFITSLSGAPGNVAAIGVVALVGLANWRALPFAIVMELGAAATYSLVNQALREPRPTADLVRITEHAGAYGWPSGHASFALVQVSLLVLCVAGSRLPRRVLYMSAAVGALVVLSFVVQRVYVGAHWPSQTLGGLLNAAGWLTLSVSIRPLSDPVLSRLPPA